MTKPSNLNAIEETTKLTWDEWIAYLDAKGGRDLAHAEIADLAREKLQDSLDNAGWWGQNVAVAYEQHIGRRQPGQRSDGTFEAAVSRTYDGSMDDTLMVWLNWITDKQQVNGVTIEGEPSSTAPARGRHWAVNLADGSRLNADVYPKSNDKNSLTITHAKLTSSEAADQWRAYWKQVIAEL